MEHFHSTAAHPEPPGHAAAHGPHGHVHESQKAVVNRLARAIGHPVSYTHLTLPTIA